jgi:hypothetical protein
VPKWHQQARVRYHAFNFCYHIKQFHLKYQKETHQQPANQPAQVPAEAEAPGEEDGDPKWHNRGHNHGKGNFLIWSEW